jgi:hypothetical protein
MPREARSRRMFLFLASTSRSLPFVRPFHGLKFSIPVRRPSLSRVRARGSAQVVPQKLSVAYVRPAVFIQTGLEIGVPCLLVLVYRDRHTARARGCRAVGLSHAAAPVCCAIRLRRRGEHAAVDGNVGWGKPCKPASVASGLRRVKFGLGSTGLFPMGTSAQEQQNQKTRCQCRFAGLLVLTVLIERHGSTVIDLYRVTRKAHSRDYNP